MPAELFLPPSRALSANATPYSGAKWFFYESGTLTPLAVYSDADLANPILTNPVVSDSGGKFPPIYFDSSKAYRGVCKNSTEDVTLHDFDPINNGSLTTFTPTGVGSVVRDITSKLQEIHSVRDYGAVGDGITDDTAAIQAGINAVADIGGGVISCPPGSYAINSAIEVKEGVTFEGFGSTLKPVGGSTLRNFVTIQSDNAQIQNFVFEGGTMVGPIVAPPEPYTFGLYKGLGIYITKTSAPIKGVRITNIVFKNFPSSAVLSGAGAGVNAIAYDLIVAGCRAETMQTYTTAETSAVFHLHGCDNSKLEDCTVVGYNWKGFYFANASVSHITRCHSFGGTAGHASHYLTGCTDCSIEDCTHSGNLTGFGFKCFNSARPVVTNFHAFQPYQAGLFSGCTGFSGELIFSEGMDGAFLGVDGDLSRPTSGSLSQLFAVRSTDGTLAAHTGIKFTNYAGCVVDGVSVSQYDFANMLYGFHFNNGGNPLSDIKISDGRLRNNQQYAVVGGVGECLITRNVFEFDSAAPAGMNFSYDGGPGLGTLTVSYNSLTGLTTSDIIQIGETLQTRWSAVNLLHNTTVGGARFLDAQLNANVADQVKMLTIFGNRCLDLATEAYTITFNTTTKTLLSVDYNTFVNSSLAPLAASLPNIATGVVEITGVFSYTGSPETVFAARVGSRYIRTDGGAGTVTYVKESGTAKTGWIAK